MKDGNDIQEDSPRDSKQKGISKKRPRASKRKRVLKARKDLQNDAPTSCTAETIIEQDYYCSHPSSSCGYCDVCEEYLPVYCHPPIGTCAEATLRMWPRIRATATPRPNRRSCVDKNKWCDEDEESPFDLGSDGDATYGGEDDESSDDEGMLYYK